MPFALKHNKNSVMQKFYQTTMCTINTQMYVELFLFHIHYKKNEWLDAKNYERLIRVNKWPFWKAKWAYKLHIFSRVKRVKKYATSKAIWPWKKAVYSQGSTVHSFECTKSFMNFRINVEHVCLLFPGFNESYIALNICGLIWPLVVCSNYVVLKL